MTRFAAFQQADRRWTTYGSGPEARVGFVKIRQKKVVDRFEVGYHVRGRVVVKGAGPSWEEAFARADLAEKPKAKLVVMPPLPRGVVCPKMCARCPFKPDGSGYAQGHPDLPNIVQSVERGMPFYCHETVIKDPRTTLNGDGDPDPAHQSHFELCRGGHERRMKVWREGVISCGRVPGEVK